MSVRSAKANIREARLKAGLTQQQMAAGICSLQALSRIESGVSGVSPATFQALMEHAGAPCERFPAFSSRADFDCYCSLQYARFHLDVWQLKDAWDDLQETEDRNWADNKFYYQEWLLLHCELQFYSYCCSHEQNRDILLCALRITRPDIDIRDFGKLFLTQNEIEILIFLAQEFLYLGDTKECSLMCAQLENYLTDSKFSVVEKNKLLAELIIVQTKYLIFTGEYLEALRIADAIRQDIPQRKNTALLLCLTFLSGLCCYYMDDLAGADFKIKAAFYSAHAIKSCYASVCRRFLTEHTSYAVSDYMISLSEVPLVAYPTRIPHDISGFSDGIYSVDTAGAYTLGNIIKDFRVEQRISQQILCQGLCSKSKLSKIENGTLQPDIALAEALLQRLGLSERIFTFWGSEKDARFYDLKYKLLDVQHLPEKKKIYLNEMFGLLQKDDTLYRQHYLAVLASCITPSKKRIDALIEALHLTLPDFNIHELCRYRLTWEEISILNSIASAYRHTEKSYLSSVYLSQLLEYKDKVHPSLRLQVNTFSHTLSKHCESLYSQKHFVDILALQERYDWKLLKHSITCYSTFLFYYCQALGECGHYEEALLPAIYCCNIEYLTGFDENGDILKKYLQKDFSIELSY